jgi:hypothetical protein
VLLEWTVGKQVVAIAPCAIVLEAPGICAGLE